MFKKIALSSFFFFILAMIGKIISERYASATVNDVTRMASPAATDSFRSVEYVDNADGDTIKVNLPSSIPNIFGHHIPVRIRHVDTAEIRGKGKCEAVMAIKAKVAVSNILKAAKKIDLEDVGRDKYFRILATVIITQVDGTKKSLSDFLLTNGYAVPYEGDTKQTVNWCGMSPMQKK